MSKNNTHKTTVYFNSACPVCNAGIGHEKKRMNACHIEWKDVHTDAEASSELDAAKEFIRERLHVVNEEGEVKVGIDAFIALWVVSERDRWKASFLKMPIIHPVSSFAYKIFARLLYRYNKLLNHW